MRSFKLVGLYAVTVWIVFVALRIEVLNAKAGYRLPNDRMKAESRKVGGSGAWRAMRLNEEMWRKAYWWDVDGRSGARPLTADRRFFALWNPISGPLFRGQFVEPPDDCAYQVVRSRSARRQADRDRSVR